MKDKPKASGKNSVKDSTVAEESQLNPSSVTYNGF
jgi:hypothetical protein